MEHIHLPHDHGENVSHIMERIPACSDFAVVTDLFRQLGDPNRTRIFWLLCHCEECVINLSAMVEMTSPAVSHHLKQLRSAGLITSTRKGKEVYYRAADTLEANLLHRMIEEMMEITCPDASSGEPHISRE